MGTTIKSKVFLAWLLILMLLGTFPISTVYSTSFVTQDANTITIENSYYKAIFDKKASDLHGRIRYFYIKPDTTNNIIPDNNWKMFAGHEVITANGTTEHDPRDWATANVENVSTSVVYSSNEAAIVQTDKWWKTYADGYYQVHIVSYWVFYENQPYYLESHERVYEEDWSFFENLETCYFFNETWVSTYHTLGEDGSVLTDSNPTEYVQFQDTPRLDRYPWVHFLNTSANLGFGIILLDASPTYTNLWPYFHSAGNYIEAQVQSQVYAARTDEAQYHTLLNYVTNDYNDVHYLAGNLTSATEVTESFVNTVRLNENKPTTGYTRGDFSVIGNRLHFEPYSSNIKSRWLYADKGSDAYVKYVNSTNTYNLYAWSSMTWEDYYWNGSYGTVTFQNEFEGKIRLRWTYELWSDSDCVRQTLNFTTLASVNITSLYASYNEIIVATNVKRLNVSVIKLYDYDSYYESWVEEAGAAFQNISGCATNEVLSAYANFYALNQTEQVEAANQSFVMVIKEQHYYRLKSESLGEFDANDILAFGERENNRFFVSVWNKFPLLNNQDFRIKHYGYGNIVGADTYDGANRLSLIVAGLSGTTSTIQIYIADKGQPVSVSGATYTYNPTTKILTLRVSHTSAKSVVVHWNITSGLVFTNVFSNVFFAIGLLGLVGIVFTATTIIYAVKIGLNSSVVVVLVTTLVFLAIVVSIAALLVGGIQTTFS